MTAKEGLRVETRGVSRTFRLGRGTVTAVDDVSVILAPGEFVGLAGRSGSGKTTLLTLLAGLLPPTGGCVLHDESDLATVSRAEGTRLLRNVGIVFQDAPLLPRLPVWENVTCGLVALGVPADERRRLAAERLDGVGLGGFEERRPEQLSTGERQRVALARATVHEPRLLVGDEPTSNLDGESAAIVGAVLSAEHARGCTVILATHDDDLLALTERSLLLDGGRIL